MFWCSIMLKPHFISCLLALLSKIQEASVIKNYNKPHRPRRNNDPNKKSPTISTKTFKKTVVENNLELSHVSFLQPILKISYRIAGKTFFISKKNQRQQLRNFKQWLQNSLIKCNRRMEIKRRQKKLTKTNVCTPMDFCVNSNMS